VKDRHVGPVRLDWREQTVDARRLAGGVELRPAQESGDAVPPDVVVGDHDGHRSPAVTVVLARAVLFDEPPDVWRLAADSRVGVLRLDNGQELRATPKLAIPQLMSS
jgi:hypothetical protein